MYLDPWGMALLQILRWMTELCVLRFAPLSLFHFSLSQTPVAPLLFFFRIPRPIASCTQSSLAATTRITWLTIGDGVVKTSGTPDGCKYSGGRD